MSNDQQPGTLKKAFDKSRMHGLYATSAVLDSTIGFLTGQDQVAPGLVEKGNKIYYKYHPQDAGNPAVYERSEAERKALAAKFDANEADRKAHPLREAQEGYAWLMRPDHYDPDGDLYRVKILADQFKRVQQAGPPVTLASLDASGTASDWAVYQNLLTIIEKDYQTGLGYQKGKLDKTQGFLSGKVSPEKYLDPDEVEGIRGQVSDVFMRSRFSGMPVTDPAEGGAVVTDEKEAVAKVFGRRAARYAKADLPERTQDVAYFKGLQDKGSLSAFAEMFGEENVPAQPKAARLRISQPKSRALK